MTSSRTPASCSAFRITSRPYSGCRRISRALVRRELARLVQHAIGDAHLADVVQRRQAGQQLDALGRQVVAVLRIAAPAARPARARSAACATSGLPGLGSRMPVSDSSVCTIRRCDAAFSSPGACRRAAVRPSTPATVIAASEPPMPSVGIERRDERRRTTPAAGAAPSPTSAHAADGARGAPGRRRRGARTAWPAAPSASPARVSMAPACWRARDEVALQQVVGHRGLHLDAGEQRVERRGHHLARAERRRAHEHQLVVEGPARRRGPASRRRPRCSGNVCFSPR